MNGMSRLLLILVFSLSCSDSGRREVHFNAFVADTHNDVLMRVMRDEDISIRTKKGHSDIVRLLEGGMDLQVFSIWVNPSVYVPDHAYDYARFMIEKLYEIQAKVPHKMEIVKTFADLERVEKTGKLGAAIGVEGGHCIENSLENLKLLHEQGMCYLSLTWNNSTDWATSAYDETERGDSLSFKGLTDFGREVVERCNELGVMVDISHAGEETFWDVIETSSKPIIASHSSAYSLCPHFRNLKDDQLKAIGANGGVVFVNFNPGFIDSSYWSRKKEVEERFKTELGVLKIRYDPNSIDYWYAYQDLLVPHLLKVAPSVNKLVDHIDYIVKLIGVDHVGLGSDFDGIDHLPKGMKDCTELPVITEKLMKRGYTVAEVTKILGGNFKRVFKEVVG